MMTEAKTETSAVDTILRKLFTNGAGQRADRLLLVKDELHPHKVTVNNAQYLGGYNRDAVFSILHEQLAEIELARDQLSSALSVRDTQLSDLQSRLAQVEKERDDYREELLRVVKSDGD